MNDSDKVIEESEALLHKSGFRFTVDDLAKELKMSKKTIYSLFKDKKELAEKVFDSSKSKVISSMDEGIIKCTKNYISYLHLTRSDVFNRFGLTQSLLFKVNEDKRLIFEKYYSAFCPKDKGNKETWRMVIESSFPMAYKKSISDKEVSDLLEVINLG